MTHIKNIRIPQPCSQSWQQMTPVEQGRHCESCCKTVVDFTPMSNDEIISYLSTKTNVCGRIEGQQLNSINYKLYADNLSAASWRKRIIMLIGLIGPLSFYKAIGQTKHAVVSQPDTARHKSASKPDGFPFGEIVFIPDSKVSRVIKGHVISKDDGLPLPGATIKLAGNNIGTASDVNGNFKFESPISPSDTLKISFVGYQPQEISLKQIEPYYNISMEPMYTICTAVVGGITVRRLTLPERIWHKIKRIF